MQSNNETISRPLADHCCKQRISSQTKSSHLTFHFPIAERMHCWRWNRASNTYVWSTSGTGCQALRWFKRWDKTVFRSHCPKNIILANKAPTDLLVPSQTKTAWMTRCSLHTGQQCSNFKKLFRLLIVFFKMVLNARRQGSDWYAP